MVSPQQSKYTKGGIKQYFKYVDYSGSYLKTIIFELLNIFVGNLHGAIGIFLRKAFKFFFKKADKVIFGKSLILRGVSSIELGKKTILDDYSALDARDGGEISIGKNVFLGRFSVIAAKGAKISLADGVNIGTNCRIASQSKLKIEEGTLIGAYSYIGPGNHKIGKLEQMDIKGGVTIGKNTWIGARVTILDGVNIGDNVVIGAHSFVNKSIPSNTVVAGTPAKVIKK